MMDETVAAHYRSKLLSYVLSRWLPEYSSHFSGEPPNLVYSIHFCNLSFFDLPFPALRLCFLLLADLDGSLNSSILLINVLNTA